MATILAIGAIYMEKRTFTAQPEEGEVRSILAGKSPNACIACCSLLANGDIVIPYWPLGNDPDTLRLLSEMYERGRNRIDLSHIPIEDTIVTRKMNITSNAGHDEFILDFGENTQLTEFDLEKIEELMRDAKLLMLDFSLEPEDLYRLIEKANEMNIPVSVDFPAYNTEFDLSRLGQATWLMPNHLELAQRLGLPETEVSTKEEIESAVKLFRESGVTGNILVSAGARGCFVLPKNGEEPIHFPAPVVIEHPVDSMGAGDILRAAFLHLWLEGKPVEVAIDAAQRLAAKSLLIMGVGESLDEIPKLWNEVLRDIHREGGEYQEPFSD